MKKASQNSKNGMRAEYDFASMKGGRRGKYVKQLRESTNVVVLDPEIAEVFPNDQAVNEALRGVLNTARAVRRSGGLANKTLRSRHQRRKA